jgi:hypothetical protein
LDLYYTVTKKHLFETKDDTCFISTTLVGSI